MYSTSLFWLCIRKLNNLNHYPYNKKNISRRLWEYGFYFLVLKTIFYSLRSFVKYCFHHSKIKAIFPRHREISSMYITVENFNKAFVQITGWALTLKDIEDTTQDQISCSIGEKHILRMEKKNG